MIFDEYESTSCSVITAVRQLHRAFSDNEAEVVESTFEISVRLSRALAEDNVSEFLEVWDRELPEWMSEYQLEAVKDLARAAADHPVEHIRRLARDLDRERGATERIRRLQDVEMHQASAREGAGAGDEGAVGEGSLRSEEVEEEGKRQVSEAEDIQRLSHHQLEASEDIGWLLSQLEEDEDKDEEETHKPSKTEEIQSPSRQQEKEQEVKEKEEEEDKMRKLGETADIQRLSRLQDRQLGNPEDIRRLSRQQEVEETCRRGAVWIHEVVYDEEVVVDDEDDDEDNDEYVEEEDDDMEGEEALSDDDADDDFVLPVGAGPARLFSTREEVNDGIARVLIEDMGFRPPKLEVEVGTLVSWSVGARNRGTHILSLGLEDDDLESDPISPGSQPFTWLFTSPGVYHYRSQIFTFMKGTVTVKESSSQSESSSLTSAKSVLKQTHQSWPENAGASKLTTAPGGDHPPSPVSTKYLGGWIKNTTGRSQDEMDRLKASLQLLHTDTEHETEHSDYGEDDETEHSEDEHLARLPADSQTGLPQKEVRETEKLELFSPEHRFRFQLLEDKGDTGDFEDDDVEMPVFHLTDPIQLKAAYSPAYSPASSSSVKCFSPHLLSSSRGPSALIVEKEPPIRPSSSAKCKQQLFPPTPTAAASASHYSRSQPGFPSDTSSNSPIRPAGNISRSRLAEARCRRPLATLVVDGLDCAAPNAFVKSNGHSASVADKPVELSGFPLHDQDAKASTTTSVSMNPSNGRQSVLGQSTNQSNESDKNSGIDESDAIERVRGHHRKDGSYRCEAGGKPTDAEAEEMALVEMEMSMRGSGSGVGYSNRGGIDRNSTGSVGIDGGSGGGGGIGGGSSVGDCGRGGVDVGGVVIGGGVSEAVWGWSGKEECTSSAWLGNNDSPSSLPSSSSPCESPVSPVSPAGEWMKNALERRRMKRASLGLTLLGSLLTRWREVTAQAARNRKRAGEHLRTAAGMGMKMGTRWSRDIDTESQALSGEILVWVWQAWAQQVRCREISRLQHSRARMYTQRVKKIDLNMSVEEEHMCRNWAEDQTVETQAHFSSGVEEANKEVGEKKKKRGNKLRQKDRRRRKEREQALSQEVDQDAQVLEDSTRETTRDGSRVEGACNEEPSALPSTTRPETLHVVECEGKDDDDCPLLHLTSTPDSTTYGHLTSDASQFSQYEAEEEEEEASLPPLYPAESRQSVPPEDQSMEIYRSVEVESGSKTQEEDEGFVSGKENFEVEGYVSVNENFVSLKEEARSGGGNATRTKEIENSETEVIRPEMETEEVRSLTTWAEVDLEEPSIGAIGSANDPCRENLSEAQSAVGFRTDRPRWSDMELEALPLSVSDLEAGMVSRYSESLSSESYGLDRSHGEDFGCSTSHRVENDNGAGAALLALLNPGSGPTSPDRNDANETGYCQISHRDLTDPVANDHFATSQAVNSRLRSRNDGCDVEWILGGTEEWTSSAPLTTSTPRTFDASSAHRILSQRYAAVMNRLRGVQAGDDDTGRVQENILTEEYFPGMHSPGSGSPCNTDTRGLNHTHDNGTRQTSAKPVSRVTDERTIPTSQQPKSKRRSSRSKGRKPVP